MDILNRFYLSAVLGSLIIFSNSCATSPTGRRQLLAMPDSQLGLMGSKSFDDMKSKIPVDKDQKRNEYVRCIVLPIIREIPAELKGSHVPAAEKDWEIVVFQDSSANAFALPGGKIGVHTGILPVAKTDAQLAAVLGHEVGHVLARHGNERVSEGLAAQIGVMGIAALLSGEDTSPTKLNLMTAALGAGTQYGILLPHSRAQENEGDLIGLDLMARAGFDPRQSVDLWKNMSAGGKAPPEFLSTHPSGSTRIDNLQAHMKDAMGKYQQAQAAGKKPHCSL